jgi:hypothetical protein
MTGHPDRRTWRRYARGECASLDIRDRLLQHLRDCSKCLEVVAGLPPPTLRVLGRPLTPAITDFDARERDIRLLEKLVLARRREGGIVRVSGNWLSEPAVYHVLSSAFSRLKRRGLYAVIRDETWNCGPAPRAGNAVVECLLQAPNYCKIADWERPEPGQVRVLCGLDEDWSRVGDEVDLCVSESDPEAALTMLYRRQIGRIERAWAHGALQPALVAIGLGWDVPRASLSSPPPRLLVPVGKQFDWYSTEGSWLVWGLLSRNLASGKWILPSCSSLLTGKRRREVSLIRTR